MEQSLCQYIPHMVQEVLDYKGLGSNWISVVTNHVQGAKEVMNSLIQQMEQINLAIASNPNNQVAATEDAKMLHKDILELFYHYKSLEKEIKEIHLENTLLYRDLKTLQSKLEEGQKSSQVHTAIPEAQKAMNEVLSMWLDNHNCNILALEEEVDTLSKENIEIREELKETRASLYSMQDQIDCLLSCIPTPAPHSALVHFEEPRSLSRLSLRSNKHFSGNDSFYSYGNNEDAQRQVPRHIMMT
ncbi:hypothetical protein DSO57_1025315 [Entomophthora muscae]|uniref:Uncharacterized protein n=1 Tax=Entomophthora muscae TaxID=34485 RepID=A0ACC2S4R4_9FUNG|nr:hypothetical protein DSO57_1025315 [Entomophthora muscae]